MTEMTTTALTVHEGGQDLSGYIAALGNPTAIKNQQMLSAAYDVACAALIGPNDVQKDGGREFKKKSAWRKLARHFNISVAASLDSVRVDAGPDGTFTAFAVATASAPWGQSWSDVGACGSDEASGRRTITVADAIATAMTRASNRAVSNLIAMGEVSAEELGNRGGFDNRPASRPASNGGAQRGDAVTTWPFGDKKGTPLNTIATDELEKMLKWCRGKGKTDIAEAIGNVLAERALGSEAGGFTAQEETEMENARYENDHGEIPF